MIYQKISKPIKSLQEVRIRKKVDCLICDSNTLQSLEGCPDHITSLVCDNNLLTNLIGCPPSVKQLQCDNNLLTTLKGCSPNLIGCISIAHNKDLIDISDLPPTVECVIVDYSDNISILPKQINKTLTFLYPSNTLRKHITENKLYEVLKESSVDIVVSMKSDTDLYFDNIL